ncbi:hypothetical protein B296_00054641 [Ensete ventricosum]|uniref:Uncharacterized protein n=1 Tax=Ensete ventricosum TaxID=4639 RepID=A0A426XSF8_ENSVE|nr:hypothetical protein B296_00054641 [Ensete ventricosum]
MGCHILHGIGVYTRKALFLALHSLRCSSSSHSSSKQSCLGFGKGLRALNSSSIVGSVLVILYLLLWAKAKDPFVEQSHPVQASTAEPLLPTQS